MAFIHLTTFIAAPIERVFDLSRSVDLHKHSMKRFGERPIAGQIAGLMNLNDTVTWQAKHLFKERILKVQITALQRPFAFVDEQVQGDLKEMKHEHYFKSCANGTIMIDQFHFDIRYGTLGQWFNRLYLRRYMEKLLEERNQVIKKIAEGNQWKHFLQNNYQLA